TVPVACAARPPPRPTLFPYTTLFRSRLRQKGASPCPEWATHGLEAGTCPRGRTRRASTSSTSAIAPPITGSWAAVRRGCSWISRSEEHTSELQSRENLVCRLLLEKKK